MTARSEAIAAVLAEHQTEQLWKAGGWAGDTGCSCGWRMGMWSAKDFPPIHRAHVADALDAALSGRQVDAPQETSPPNLRDLCTCRGGPHGGYTCELCR